MEKPNISDRMPYFLDSFDNLTAHFDEHFGDLGSNDRGDNFLDLASKLIALTDIGRKFPSLQKSKKKSWDQGIDLYSNNLSNNKCLCVQSKYKLRNKDEFDTVISKFKNYEENNSLDGNRKQLCFEGFGEDCLVLSPPQYIVITSSKLSVILKKYQESTLASLDFFKKLQHEERIVIIDGPQILNLLQQFYKKTHLVPSNIKLRAQKDWHQCGNVFLGAVRGKDLIQLYKDHGDALFFENIRDFLGTTSNNGKKVPSRTTVNDEITKTINQEPSNMLARNNGLTFRATEVFVLEDGDIKLTKAAIVNGCQTTMCLVHCDKVPDDCMVQVKIVKTEDAWDIAKAANYQNQVTRVDLDLARYLRPQLVRRVSISLGYAVETGHSESASAVLNSIYRSKIDYEELRLLVLGLFSRKPNNLFEGNYTELRADVLERLYELKDGDEVVFSVLLLILKESRDVLAICEEAFSGEEYSSIFKRFFDENKPRYRVFISIISLCALLRDDISQRSSDADKEFKRTQNFLFLARKKLENESSLFQKVFLMTFQAVADMLLDIPGEKQENEIAQTMYNKISSCNFTSIIKRILMRIDSQSKINI